MTVKSVAVVGVGSAGLAAIKWCRERGLEVVGYERESDCGGVWHQGTAHSPAYDSLFTNSSNKLMELSDFPFPFKTSQVFPKHAEILRYYRAYKDHFGLDKFVRWNTGVRRVEKIHEKGVWRVETEHGDVDYYDAVMLCTGKLWDPRLPPWAHDLAEQHPEIDVLHAKMYRNPDRFRKRSVVIVGIGNSALDIALELSQHEDIDVCISCRRGTSIVPTRDSAGNPTDQKLARRFVQYKLPSKARLLYLYYLVNAANKSFRDAGLPEPPTGLFGPRSPSANLKQTPEFLRQLRNGRIRFVPEATGESVIGSDGKPSLQLADGSTVRADAVICCTGYTLRLDKVLGPKETESISRVAHWKGGRSVPWLRMYRHCMHPQDPTLFLCGFVTSFGNETCISEMQSRWATAVMAGLIPAPTSEKIEKDLAMTEFFLNQTQPSLSGFVRYIPYLDAMAEDLGATPEVDFWSDPRLYLQMLFNPVVPAHYRIFGLDALPREQLRSRL
ncbi:Dimethylaniline monooxygenase N-oxide-forming 5 [Hondaea fermentalgiana]|uniref:Dimethylaniline monooxygenase N-oxide-forming 5 n=1 Tax=Hondaea fermentalgiana TaxID=2315210 RepID=A0A2R5GF22_9STRA|nr:Dimethylaniline monooxygenase N-oxide-forming 5 [Hondaea fermentalgiana]|eukprot:GBG29526.1 Dimethylaniline monooxygenase N-oxide-forming 5 [Hondaea fermentalgiana]